MFVFGSEMKPFLRWCYVATALMLAGCSNHDWRKDEVLAIPLQPTLQQEVILARMEQILASRALTDDERAQLYMSAVCCMIASGYVH